MNARHPVIALAASITTALVVGCSAAPTPEGEGTGSTQEALPQNGPGGCTGPYCNGGAPVCAYGGELNTTPSTNPSLQFEYVLHRLGCYGKQEYLQPNLIVAFCPTGNWIYEYCTGGGNAPEWMNAAEAARCFSNVSPVYSGTSTTNDCTRIPLGSGTIQIGYDPNCSGSACAPVRSKY